jgi:hypothetical protein
MKNVAILGLGPSASLFNPAEFDWSIGVNDIWRIVKTDDIVCLDKPSIFKADRLMVINNSIPHIFWSQMVAWDTRPDFRKIDFLPGYPDRICNIDGWQLNKSYCSPFVACQIAWKFYAAQEVHLFGVDLLNHPHLDRVLCAKIRVHFINLKAAFAEKSCKLIVHGEGILKDI